MEHRNPNAHTQKQTVVWHGFKETLEGHSKLTLFEDTLVGHLRQLCLILLRDTLFKGPSCVLVKCTRGTLLRDTLVEHFCLTRQTLKTNISVRWHPFRAERYPWSKCSTANSSILTFKNMNTPPQRWSEQHWILISYESGMWHYCGTEEVSHSNVHKTVFMAPVPAF